MADLTTLPGRLRKVTTQAKRLPATLARDVQQPAERAVLTAARAKRGTLSVSGIRATLDVDGTVAGGGASATLLLSATPRRAWGIVSGTRPHAIGSRRGKVLPLGGNRFAAKVDHPGTRRVRLWSESVRRSRTVVVRSADTAAKARNPFR